MNIHECFLCSMNWSQNEVAFPLDSPKLVPMDILWRSTSISQKEVFNWLQNGHNMEIHFQSLSGRPKDILLLSRTFGHYKNQRRTSHGGHVLTGNCAVVLAHLQSFHNIVTVV